MRRLASLLVALALTLTLAGAPASAAPPERVEDSIFIVFPDLTYGLVVFWNTTRNDVCAWAEGGFDGPPPVTQQVDVLLNPTPSGSVMAQWSATAHLELWSLDAGADLSNPCDDTDDSTAPWAVGSAHVQYTDNDLFVSLTRTNSFGERAQGTVWDAAGTTWHYGWVFRALIDRDGGFRVVVPDRSVLAQRGR